MSFEYDKDSESLSNDMWGLRNFVLKTFLKCTRVDPFSNMWISFNEYLLVGIRIITCCREKMVHILKHVFLSL